MRSHRIPLPLIAATVLLGSGILLLAVALVAMVQGHPWWSDLVVIGVFITMLAAYGILLHSWIRSASFVVLMLRRLNPCKFTASEPFLRASMCAAEADRIIRRWCSDNTSSALIIEAYMRGFTNGLYESEGELDLAWRPQKLPFNSTWTRKQLIQVNLIGYRHGLLVIGPVTEVTQ